jgi:hypothetical protein
MLESRESWKYGDLAAFHDVTSKDSHINDDWITHAAVIYPTIAAPLGSDIPENLV